EFAAAANDNAAGGGDADQVEASVEEALEDVAEFGALPSRSSATVDPPTFKDWSGNEAQKRARSGETPAYYGRIYAWRDPNKDPGHMTAYKCPHHAVSPDGTPGAAVMWAVHASIGMIDDSNIPRKDWR